MAKEQEAECVKNKKNVKRLLYAVAGIVIVAAVVLGVYAVKTKDKNAGSDVAGQSDVSTEQPKDNVNDGSVTGNETDENEEQTYDTVKEYAESKNMSVKEFKEEYGLTDESYITENSSVQESLLYMSLDNYAKFCEMTVEDLKQRCRLGDDVDNSTKWIDAVQLMPTSAIAEIYFNLEFDEFKERMQLPDNITSDTPWHETLEFVNEKFAAEEESEKSEN